MILEALVIGTIASVIGLFLGLGLAKGLTALFDSIGFDLPKTGLVFAGRTIAVSLLAGILITLIAGVFPAIRATRVAPIAAVREGATLPQSRWARFTPWVGAVITAIGIALLVYGSLADPEAWAYGSVWSRSASASWCCSSASPWSRDTW